MGSLKMPGLRFCVRICLMGGPDTRTNPKEGRGAKEPTNMPEQSDTTSRADTLAAATEVRPGRWVTDADGTNNLSFRGLAHDDVAARRPSEFSRNKFCHSPLKFGNFTMFGQGCRSRHFCHV